MARHETDDGWDDEAFAELWAPGDAPGEDDETVPFADDWDEDLHDLPDDDTDPWDDVPDEDDLGRFDPYEGD